MNNSRDYIKAGLLNEGAKAIINPGARIEYRAAGGHYGAYYPKQAIEVTIINSSQQPGERYGKETNVSYVDCKDAKGNEYRVDTGICCYSFIDCGAVRESSNLLPVVPIKQ